ncbi:polyprotein 1 [Common water moss secovirus]|uniref:RNA1 polyprotein n=1 Tax=Common water moss secovirus TaxID=2933167 RepID=A0A9C7GX17_9SECO|nr:polyprotein 1 [Common water moss secovirus]CAI5383869.1 polyprotein 1 [Common water moss secovirus]
MDTILGRTYVPKIFVEEDEFLQNFLQTDARHICQSIAVLGELDLKVVARAAANGVFSCHWGNAEIFDVYGAPITVWTAIQRIRSFQNQHTQRCKAGMRYYEERLATIHASQQRKLQRAILAELDCANGRTVCEGEYTQNFHSGQHYFTEEVVRMLKERRRQSKCLKRVRTQFREAQEKASVVRARAHTRLAFMVHYGGEQMNFDKFGCVRICDLPICDEIKAFFSGKCTVLKEKLAQTILRVYEHVQSGLYFAPLVELVRDGTDQKCAEYIKLYEDEDTHYKILKDSLALNGITEWVRSSAKAVYDIIPTLGKAGAVAKDVVDYATDKVRAGAEEAETYAARAAHAFGNAIFECMKEQFFKCVGPFLGALTFARDEIEKYWRYIKEWALKMVKLLPIEAAVLAECTWWALALMLATGIVQLVNKILVDLKLAEDIGMLRRLFATCFYALAVDGWGALLGFKNMWYGVIKALLGDMFGSWQHLIAQCGDHMYASHTCNAGVTDIPYHFLEVLGRGICSSPLGTLQHLGKYGQALDQIKKGKDVVKELVGYTFDIFADSWDAVSGKKDNFFRTIKALTQIDIEGWIVDAQRSLIQAQTIAVTDKVLFDEVSRLLFKGIDLQVMLAGAERSTALDYSRLVSVLVGKLLELRERCARVGKFEGRRQEPFWVYMYGKSHCGKSLFMEDVSRALLSENGHSVNDIYSKNARDDFWSGYMQHTCVQFDDLSACETTPSIESEFLQLVGSKAYSLNMAAVEDKGMLFNSSFIVSTSNVYTAPTNAKVLDINAYNNRRNVVIQCRAAPGVVFSADDPTASCEARIMDRLEETPLTEWKNCMEILEQVVAMSVEHRNHERALHSNFLKRNARHSPIIYRGKNFLKEKIGGIPYEYLYCDNLIYKLDKETGKAELVCNKDGTPMLNNDTSCELDCQDMVSNWNTSFEADVCGGMLKTFMYNLVREPGSITSVSSVSKDMPPTTKSFFLDLELAERIYLRLIQKNMDRVKSEPELCFNIDIKRFLLDSIERTYRTVIANGGKIICIAAAMVILYLTYNKFFKLFETFVKGGTGASIYSMLNINACSASSLYSGTTSNGTYASHNVPIYYRQRTSASVNAGEEDNYLRRLLAWITLPNGVLISCIRFGARKLFLTKHQALCIAEGTRVNCNYLDTKGVIKSIRLVWTRSKLQYFTDTEAVVYTDASLTPMPKGDLEYFNIDVDILPKLFTINAVVMKQKRYMRNIDPEMEDMDEQQPIENRWESQGRINRVMQGINNAAMGGTYQNMLSTSISSNCPTSSEDCGAILTTMYNGKRYVIGMHVASGHNREGHFVSTACLLPTELDIEMTVNSSIPMLEESGVDTAGYRKIGWIPNIGDRPYISGTTMFKPVPDDLIYKPEGLYEKLDDGTILPVKVEIKEPAILKSTDSRIPKGTTFDPLLDGMKKFSTPMAPLDDALCKEIATDIAETWHDCFSDLMDVSEEVAINGNEEDFFDSLNMNTSEGYPWVKERKIGQSGKARYFELKGDTGMFSLKKDTNVYRAYVDLQNTSQVQIPVLVCCETPKDECLPLRKIIEKPKTRLFSILPLEYNLLLRKKFLAFAAKLQTHRDVLPTQVGIDPYGREWAGLYNRLREKNDLAINCDYSSFDGLLTSQVLEHIGYAINQVYGDSEASKKQRHNLLMAIINRKSICGSQVFEVSAGIPSGCALTVLLNSIYNEFLIRYVWKTTVTGVPREQFSTYVSLLVYGDDNLIAVRPEYLDRFNGQVIQKKLAAVNVHITDGTDKTALGIFEKPLCRLDFLKRRFKKMDDGIILAPLDLSSIFTCLQNATLGAGSIVLAVQQNVRVVLTEIYLHQREDWYNDIRNFYVKNHGWIDLPTWSATHVFHRMHMTGVAPWEPHRLFDIPVDGRKLQMAMANQGEEKFCAKLAERMFVCGVGWNVTDPEHQYVISTIPLVSGERLAGMHVPVVFGEGRGRLPTVHWARKFRSSRSDVNQCILREYNAGKIIYFRSEPAYVAGWVAAINFAMCLNFDTKAMVELYHNVCTPDAKTIYEYCGSNYRERSAYVPPPIVLARRRGVNI